MHMHVLVTTKRNTPSAYLLQNRSATSEVSGVIGIYMHVSFTAAQS